MGVGVSGGGAGWAGRLLRLLLLPVLVLTAIEYVFGFILEASRSSATISSVSNSKRPQYWPNNISITSDSQTPAKQTVDISSYIRKNNSSKNHTNISPNNTMGAPTNAVSSTSGTIVISKIIESIKNIVTTEKYDYKMNEADLPLCDEVPSDLGQVPANTTDLELEDVEKKYPEVHSGGWYSPPNCTTRHRVAIIVPYRDRQQHLAIFLNHMHPFLMKQQIEYGIYILEQSDNHGFNRAKLMNVGFTESQRITGRRYQCFIFHDIDLLPLDSRNMYSCPRQPRHMSVSIDIFSFRLPYDQLFGGVSAMTEGQFKKVNGFSNKYWGWGGEDDDMSYRYRLSKVNYHIGRYKMSVARYAMLAHKKTPPNPKRYKLLSQTRKIFQKDGLSNLSYKLVKITHHRLYTHILVNIEERS